MHLGYFFPGYGGTVTRNYNLLSRLPYNVRLLASDRTLEGEVIAQKEDQFGNTTVYRIPLVPSTMLQNVAILRYFHTISRHSSIITRFALNRNFNIDIIHAHGPIPFGQAAQKLSEKWNKPLVMELHAVLYEYGAGFLDRLKVMYIEKVNKRLFQQCEHIVTLTQSMRKWITSAYKVPEDKITVVPNGADTEQFSPKDEYRTKAAELRERLGINGRIIMYAGFMDRINGMKDLAIVIPQIIQKRRDVCFIFMGHGPEEKQLIALSERYPQNVKFLPVVHYDEMPAYYQMSNVFIIPRPSTISSETITPLKLLEVMAMAKPVLGSNVGGIAEVIKNGENGYLFEKGNLESLKTTLLGLLDTDNTQIGFNARKTVTDNYTWDIAVRTLQAVYQELM